MVPVLVAVILCLLTPSEAASTSDVLVTRDWEVSDKLVDIKPEWLINIFQSWKYQHGKKYGNLNEEMSRMEIWMENKKKIEDHNIRYNQVRWIPPANIITVVLDMTLVDRGR